MVNIGGNAPNWRDFKSEFKSEADKATATGTGGGSNSIHGSLSREEGVELLGMANDYLAGQLEKGGPKALAKAMKKVERLIDKKFGHTQARVLKGALERELPRLAQGDTPNDHAMRSALINSDSDPYD